jgi:hypothetical protein
LVTGGLVAGGLVSGGLVSGGFVAGGLVSEGLVTGGFVVEGFVSGILLVSCTWLPETEGFAESLCILSQAVKSSSAARIHNTIFFFIFSPFHKRVEVFLDCIPSWLPCQDAQCQFHQKYPAIS